MSAITLEHTMKKVGCVMQVKMYLNQSETCDYNWRKKLADILLMLNSREIHDTVHFRAEIKKESEIFLTITSVTYPQR